MTRHTITIKHFALAALALSLLVIAASLLLARTSTSPPQPKPSTTLSQEPTPPPTQPVLRVQWSHDASPVLQLTLTPPEPGQPLRTDERGAIPLSDLPANQALSLSTPDQRAPSSLHTLTLSDLSQSRTITLPSPATLSGKLLASNQPLPDASISLLYSRTDTLDGASSSEPYIIDPSLRSDPEGSFSIDNLPPGTFAMLIEAEGREMFTSQEITLAPAAQRDDLTLDISPKTALTASLISSQSGAPVQGTLLVYDPSTRASQRHTINPTAPLLIESLPANRPLNLIASAPGHQHLPISITLEPGQVLDEKLSLEPAPPGISALVVSPDYTPEQGALARYALEGSQRPKLLRASKQGVFRQDDTTATTAVKVFSPHYPTSSETRIRPGEPALIVLARGGEITGRVLSSRNIPIKEEYDLSVVDFQPASDRRYHRLNDAAYKARRAPDGTFSLGPLRPGTYYLRATSPQGHIAYSTPIEVSAAQTTSNVTITIQEPGKVTGRVIEQESGNPLAGATIQLLEGVRGTGGETFTTTTDAQGNFALEDIPPGRRSLRVSQQGFVTQVAAGLEVSPGQTLSQQVAMERGQDKRAFSFPGIGAVLGQDEDGIYIRQVMPKSPAEAAGVQDRDYILTIDGSVTDDMRVQDAVERIRGQENTPVRLDVRRKDGSRHTLDVTRGKVKTM